MPRKANGESSIYQDANGVWHGKVSMGLKDNGERDRRHVTGRRRADVLRKNRVLEQQREAGMAAAAGRSPTVGSWLDHWLNTIAVRKVRPSTFTRYEQLVRLHLIPGLGHHRLDRLQPEHVEALYGRMHDSGQAPASVLQAHRVLSRALKVAMQRGRVARNVATLVDAPSMVRERPVPLTGEEARRVLAAAVGTRNAARWSVALAVGLRQGEALGLPWLAVDLDVGTLTVRQALQRQRGKGLVIVEPKSDAGNRTIALPSPLRDALRHTGRCSSPSGWRRGPSGMTTGLSSPSRTAGRSTPGATTGPGWRCWPRPGSASLGCTMPGTRPRRCCASRGCPSGSSWTSSVTARSR